MKRIFSFNINRKKLLKQSYFYFNNQFISYIMKGYSIKKNRNQEQLTIINTTGKYKNLDRLQKTFQYPYKTVVI